jgi:sugar phosphate isomerase/epimerase
MIQSAITLSLVPEAKGGPFVFWDDLDTGFARTARHGFDAVEIFPPSSKELPLSRLRESMERHSLKVAAIGTGAGWVKHKLRLTDADPAVRQKAREFIHGIVNLAGFVGAPAILGSMQGRWEGDVSREQALDWLAEALVDLGQRASAHGQVFLYEPLNRYETNLFHRAAEAAAFLDERNISGVKLLCDLFHMNIEEADVAGALREVAPRLGHVHFADTNRQAIGCGHLDVAPVAAVLKEIGYAGYVSAEVLPLPDGDAAAQRTMESFKKWFPR